MTPRGRGWTEQDFMAVAGKFVSRGVKAQAAVHALLNQPVKRTSQHRSKLEAAWAQKLEYDRRDLDSQGRRCHIQYEPCNFRLPGKRNFWKPDFLVWFNHCLVFYEIKGRNKSDARSLVKMKTAAGLNPWAKFVLVHRINGEWREREIT